MIFTRRARAVIGWTLGIGVASVLAWRFLPVIDYVLNPAHWLEWLGKENSAGSILGGLVGGILTIIAGASTILLYSRQHRMEQMRLFFEWLADFNTKFHSDAAYGEIREALALRRRWVRQQLCAEMLMDGQISEQDLLAGDQHIIPADAAKLSPANLDWTFLRKFTDYLYFLEQVLAFGESLAARGNERSAGLLVDHFGWFLRSLCACWSDGDAERDKAARLFVLYLSNNRYRRLSEVAFLLLAPDQKALSGYYKYLFDEMSQILQRQGSVGGGRGLLEESASETRSYKRLRRHWAEVIGGRGSVPPR